MPAGILGNHKIKYIITGTPRSGTGYMAKLFTSAGTPIGHEMFFGMPGHGFYPVNAQGDSSWMAVPFMHNFEADIIHIVRNPLKNIASLMHRRTFDHDRMENSIYTYFKMKRLPSLHRFTGVDRYLAFYLDWNKEIDLVQKTRVRLEDMIKNPTPLLDKLGIKYDKDKLYTKKYNESNRQVADITLEDMRDCNPELLRKFTTLAGSYGYNLV